MSRIKRSTKPIKRRPRSKSEFARIYHSRERVEWVKSLGCVYCRMIFGEDAITSDCHNAHTENGGRGRKADYTTIVPLCDVHHRAYDEHRPPLASDFIRGKLKDAAKDVASRWLEAHPEETIIK